MVAEPLGLEVKAWIPYFGPAMALLNAFSRLLPVGSPKFLNNRIRKNWKEIREQQGLTSDLDLRVDRDWIGYTTGENSYDVTALKELGMEWKWPDFTEGLKATIKWYQDQEWLP